MSVNLGNLELTLLQKISNSSDPLEVQTYSKVLEVLRNGNVYSVASFSSLPIASENVGKLYYVQSEETVYFSNDSAGWVPISSQLANLIYVTGRNFCGALGTNSAINSCSYIQEASFSTNWTLVSGGYRHWVGLKSDGTLWGSSVQSFHGGGTNAIFSFPTQEFYSSTDWCWAASSYCTNTSAIKTDGTLWGAGTNTCGLLAINSTTTVCSFVQEITSSTNWTRSTNGYCHNAGLKSDGSVWSWGRNNCGQLGNGCVVDASSPVREITSSTDWCAVSAGGYGLAVALKTNGTLWGWGNPFFGIGNNNVLRCSPVQEICSATDWKEISTARRVTVALKTDGTIWGTGSGSYGVSGAGNTTNYCSFIQEFTSSTDWCFLSRTSGDTMSALKTNSTLWSWGRNQNGQLGDGSAICRSSPVQEITSRTDWCYAAAGCVATAIRNISL